MNPYPPYNQYPPNGGPSGPPGPPLGGSGNGGYNSYPPDNRQPYPSGPPPPASHQRDYPPAHSQAPYNDPYRGGGGPPPHLQSTPAGNEYGRDYGSGNGSSNGSRDYGARDPRDSRGGYDARQYQPPPPQHQTQSQLQGRDPRRDSGPGPGYGSGQGPNAAPYGQQAGSGYGGPPPPPQAYSGGQMNGINGMNGRGDGPPPQPPRDDYYGRPGPGPGPGPGSGPGPAYAPPARMEAPYGGLPPPPQNFQTRAHTGGGSSGGGGRVPLPPQEQFAPQGYRRDHGDSQGHGQGQGPGQGQYGRPDNRSGRPGAPPQGGNGHVDRGSNDRFSQGGPPGPPVRHDARQGQDRRERSPNRRGKQNDRRSHTTIDRDGRSVESRLQLERQCRTLFVRNVAYEADSDALRVDFERFGPIKTYFDIVKNRGMVFITYYDLRHAEEARVKMHGSTIRNREMDVHYSLPRGDDRSKDPDRESNQGSLLITLHGQPNLAEHDLGGLAGRYGDIKSIRPARFPEQKILEYFDSRGAVMLYDEMNQRPFMGGTLQIGFMWDELENAPVQLNPGQIPPSLEPSARKIGGPGDMGPPGRMNDDRRRDDPMGRGGRYGDAPPQGQGGGGDYGRRESGGYAPAPAGRYDAAPPRPGPPSGAGPGSMHNAQEDDRLEQARKVQNLLSSLGSIGGGGGGGGGPPGPAPPPSQAPPQSRAIDPRRQSQPQSQSQSQPQSYNYPTAATTNMPPPAIGGGIPPEVLSLLNANNANNANSAPAGFSGHSNSSMGGPTDAYRPASAQSFSQHSQHSQSGTPAAYTAPGLPQQTPPRPSHASQSPTMRISASPSGPPAGGIPGLPPKPVDALSLAPAPATSGASGSNDVGSLLAMLR